MIWESLKMVKLGQKLVDNYFFSISAFFVVK